MDTINQSFKQKIFHILHHEVPFLAFSISQVNHLLLLFKYYNARDQKHLIIEDLMKNIRNIYDIEKNLPDQDDLKKIKFFRIC